jgi:hypothetical protein
LDILLNPRGVAMNNRATESSSDKKDNYKLKYIITILLLVLIFFVIIVMILNSRKPQQMTFDKDNINVKGTAFIKTGQFLIQQAYKNWLPNDLFWPTALLDNMPNFQIGELEVLRYNVRILRDNLSRMRTTDKLDPMADKAFTALANDPYKWWMPSAESKWKQADKYLAVFYDNLLLGKTHFYPRSDNLIELLSQYASLMGGVNTRLINAPRDIWKKGPSPADRKIKQGSKGAELNAKVAKIHIPWYQIDDNFYYAQGVAYALLQSFRAIQIDFADVLADKNSSMLLKQIIRDLERCNFEPLIVFNGDPDCIFANHSLNLSGFFNDARQKINSLIMALAQG